MTSYTVTATQSVNTSNGMLLLVQVLNNATLAGTPATGTSTTAYQCSVTTTQTGSLVFGSIACLNENVTLAAASGSTLTQFGDATNTTTYAAFRTTSGTGTPGATTVGSSTAFNSFYGCCGVEIIPSGGTLTIDGSSPAVADTTSAITLTTASFTPPAAGALLVAMISTDGNGSGSPTMTVSSSPALTWTQQVSVTSSVGGTFAYVGVRTAVVPPGSTAGPALPALMPARQQVSLVTNAGWRGAQHSR